MSGRPRDARGPASAPPDELRRALAAAGRDHASVGPAGDEPLDGEAQPAYAYVLRSTQQRPQTHAELRAKLRRRGVDDDAAEAALRRAQQVGAVDDRAFARAWVDDRGLKRGYGAARLRQELRRRQVDEALIDEVLSVLEDRDDLAVATELAVQQACRYPASLDPTTVARRLVGHLVRRGHSPAIAQRAAISVAGLDRSWD